MFTKGEDRVLYIKINNDYLPIGCLTGDSFSESSEMLDTTTRDNAGWKTSVPTLQSYNISFDGLVINTSDIGGDQTKISYDRLTLLKRNKTLIEWKSQDALGVFISIGKGYITELSDSSEIDGFISFNASIIGYGKPGDITDTYFTTTWRTTTPNETITIPTNSSYTYNYNIRTSDGQVFTGVTGDKTINFTIPGDHDINIFGSFPSIYFNDTGDKDKIIDIKKWGNNIWSSFNSSFYGCSNLTGSYTDVANTVNVTDMSSMFQGASSFNSTLSFDASNVTDISNMFYGASSFNSTLTFINTLNITNMLGVFRNATSYNQITSFNTSNVTNMSFMFSGATSFNQSLGFNTSNVTNMRYMFNYATSFNQPLTSLDTSSVTNMSGMFYVATSFNQNLSFDTSSVTNMSGMFRGATSFNSTLSFSDTSNVTDMNSMFYDATSFNQPLTSWDTSSVTNMSIMFRGANSFNQPLNFDTSNVTNMSSMIRLTLSFNQPLTFDTSNVTNMFNMFAGAEAFNSTLTFSDTSNVTNIGGMFRLTLVFNQPLNFDTSSVTNMFRVFEDSVDFNQPLSWDTSNVTSMNSMFDSAASFDQSLNWDITSVLNMFNMFHNITLSTTNYNAILIYWENVLDTTFPGGTGYTPTISISFGGSQYTGGGTAAAARASLINNFNWTITDGGIV
jgi:surface protein